MHCGSLPCIGKVLSGRALHGLRRRVTMAPVRPGDSRVPSRRHLRTPPLAGPWSLRGAVCDRMISLDLAAVAVFTRRSWPTWCGQPLSLYVEGERLGPGVAGGPPDVL